MLVLLLPLGVIELGVNVWCGRATAAAVAAATDHAGGQALQRLGQLRAGCGLSRWSGRWWTRAVGGA
eukprot:scaffold1637_cov410-Prasinococcus_capsulatus_cf.AAC.34